VAALLVSAPLYGLLQWRFGEVHFLLRMLATFVAVSLVMLLITAARPLPEPRVMPVRHEIDLRASALPKWLGGAVIAAVVVIFVVFW
jgi:hypothetical protein